jgi:hypothetical protein
MKKLLAIIVLFLLASNNAFSKVIELKKCGTSKNPYSTKDYIKRSWIIDTNKSILQNITILTDEHYERGRKLMIKEFGDAKYWDKMSVTKSNIEFAGDRYVTASKYFNKLKGTYTVDLKKKTVQLTLTGKKPGLPWKCK